MSAVWESITYVAQPFQLVLVVIGCAFGMVCGALPGLSASMAIILALPFTYEMEPVASIVLLVSIYVGAACGGSISAILMKTPGTPEAVATTFDGYPMREKGLAGRALSLAVTGSSMGGIFSALVMVVAAPLLAQVALKFQSAEYFALSLIGLSCITSIGSKDQMKAVFSTLLGVLISTIGIDSVSGVTRFAFRQPFLMNGINYIPVMIGAFAVAEVYKTVQAKAEKKAGDTGVIAERISFAAVKFMEVLKYWRTITRSAIIGTVIGIVPAAGGSIAALIAYGQAVRASKTPNEFGKGCDEGVLAPETSNNAAIGGSMVPTMILGIPGSPTASIIMAAFTLHGVRTGPLLLKDQPTMLYCIFLGIVLASLLLFLVGRLVTRQFAHILKLPQPFLQTLVIMLGVVGAFALHNSYYDIVAMFVFSIIGYFFDRFKFSNSAMILGLILGQLAENNLRKQLIISNGSLIGFVTRPLALVCLLVAVYLFLSPTLKKRFGKKNAQA